MTAAMVCRWSSAAESGRRRPEEVAVFPERIYVAQKKVGIAESAHGMLADGAA